MTSEFDLNMTDLTSFSLKFSSLFEKERILLHEKHKTVNVSIAITVVYILCPYLHDQEKRKGKLVEAGDEVLWSREGTIRYPENMIETYRKVSEVGLLSIHGKVAAAFL